MTPRLLGAKLDVELNFPFEGVRGEYELCGHQFGREKTFGSLEELQRVLPELTTRFRRRPALRLGLLRDRP